MFFLPLAAVSTAATSLAPADVVLLSQTILPSGDGTLVEQTGQRFTITEGNQAGNNLFHGFEQFGLEAGQVADFVTVSGIENILGRVTGGDASLIDGLLQVSGGQANLFLLNPAGVVFGPNARLNLPASFTVTTGDRLFFGDHWLDVFGTNDYSQLQGNPDGIGFSAGESGAIANHAQLSLNPGQQLNLIGGRVQSIGSLSAGNVQVHAVPGAGRLSLGAGLTVDWQALANASPELPGNFPPEMTSEMLEQLATNIAPDLQAGDVAITKIQADQATLAAAKDLQLESSDLRTTGTLNLFAGETLRIRDGAGNPFVAKAGGDLVIRGDRAIDILALSSPETLIRSEGSLSLISDTPISGDAHFSSRGDISFLTTAGLPSDFASLYDPIISSDTGDITFGDYTGAALKVQAAGSISGGNISITQPDIPSAIPATDPDFAVLTTQPSLILRAGNAGNGPFANLPLTAGSTLFTDSPPTSGLANITVGDINTSVNDLSPSGGQAGRVELIAPGQITAGNISTNSIIGDPVPAIAGDVFIQAGGTVQTQDIQTNATSSFLDSFAGNVELISTTGDVLFSHIKAQATGSNISFPPSIGKGGDIIIDAQGVVQSFEAVTETIVATGSSQSGTISIAHGGGPNNVPFIVGDATLNGTNELLAVNGFVVPVGSSFSLLGNATLGPNDEISILSKNAAPTLAGGTTLAGDVDTSIDFGLGDLGLTINDGDGDNTTVVVSDLGNGSLQRAGVAVEVGDAIAPTDILTYAPPADVSGAQPILSLRGSDGVALSANAVQIQADLAAALPPVPPNPTTSPSLPSPPAPPAAPPLPNPSPMLALPPGSESVAVEPAASGFNPSVVPTTTAPNLNLLLSRESTPLQPAPAISELSMLRGVIPEAGLLLQPPGDNPPPGTDRTAIGPSTGISGSRSEAGGFTPTPDGGTKLHEGLTPAESSRDLRFPGAFRSSGGSLVGREAGTGRSASGDPKSTGRQGTTGGSTTPSGPDTMPIGAGAVGTGPVLFTPVSSGSAGSGSAGSAGAGNAAGPIAANPGNGTTGQSGASGASSAGGIAPVGNTANMGSSPDSNNGANAETFAGNTGSASGSDVTTTNRTSASSPAHSASTPKNSTRSSQPSQSNSAQSNNSDATNPDAIAQSTEPSATASSTQTPENIQACLEQSDSINQSNPSASGNASASNLAQAQRQRYQALITCYEQNLAQARATQNHALALYALNNIGITQFITGNYLQALKAHEQQQQLAESLGDAIQVAIAHIGSGAAQAGLGEYDRAIRQYRTALDQLPPNQVPTWRSLALRNLGNALLSKNDYASALQYQQQSLQLSQTIQDPYGEMQALANLGNSYTLSGKFDPAIAHYEQSLTLSRSLNAALEEAQTLMGLGTAYSYKRDYEQAIAYNQASLTQLRQLGNRLGEGIVLTNLGDAQLKLKQLKASEQTLRQGITVWESLRAGLGNNDAYKISLFETQLTAYQNLQEVLVDQDKPADALEIAERSRGRAFVELLARGKASAQNQSNAVVAPPNLTELKRIAQEQQATLVEYTIAREQFVETPHGASPQYATEALPYRLLIWVLSPNGNVAVREVDLLAWQKEAKQSLPQLIATARRCMNDRTCIRKQRQNTRGRGFNFNPAAATQSAAVASSTSTAKSKAEFNPAAPLAQLHQLLIEPIADLLPQNPEERVVFVPQDQLFLVPFPALRDRQGSYLVERHTIQTTPAIQLLAATRQRRQSLPSRPAQALVVGNPAPMPNGFSPLPFTEDEAVTIAQQLSTKALMGRSATETQVKQQLAKADIIHLATHGTFDAENPLAGAIALAPSPGEDGMLTAQEILDLPLNAALVVLSACDTGRGRITGDGVVGLSRSFLGAGAASVMVSLWQVPDDATSLLMKSFYEQRGQGLDHAQALRQAMLTVKQDYDDPKSWSGFTLVGEAQ